MTEPRFGRVTPVQCDMLQLAGEVLFRWSQDAPTDEEHIAAIEKGHEMLVARLGHDLGYDLRAWHELLCSNLQLRRSYQHPYAWNNVREAIERAFSDPNRERWVAALRSRGRPPP
jgi:hypothetical protein